MPSYKDLALNSQGVPSETDAIRTFRSLADTDEGAQWLEMAIDPMHDRGFRSTGLPDARVGDSVVRTITRKFTLKTALAGVPWDGLVHFTGDLNNSMLSTVEFKYDVPTPGADTGSYPLFASAGPTYTPIRYGGVVCVAGGVGSNLTYTNPQGLLCPFFEGNDPKLTTNAGESVFPKGGYRVVAGSIEAYNTTAEIYRSGAVTGYMLQNQEDFLDMTQTLSNGGAAALTAPIHLMPRGPSSIAQAIQLPGSITHTAAEGAYLPLPVNVENPLNYARFSSKVYAQREDGPQVTTFGTYPIQGGNSSGAGRAYEFGNWDLPTGCMPCGLYFTGLSDQTTIDIVVRFVIEEFPAINDIRYLTLANPSPAMDAKALRAYGMIRNELPLMVPVSWNGFGTWLKSAMKVGKSIAPILKPIGNAVLKTAAKSIPGGQVALDAANMVKDAIAESGKKKKKKSS